MIKKEDTLYIFDVLIEKIKHFKKIAIFRHIHPDFDALSAALALKEAIIYNFPDEKKDIKILGDNNDNFIKNKIYPKTDKVSNNWFSSPFLSIILDTPNKSRISDPRWEKGNYKIKIDHHPIINEIGDAEYVDVNASSTCEILATLFEKHNIKINKEIATFLYIGLVGDSGRFRYNSTNEKTFYVAQKLLEFKIDLNDIYTRMYSRDLQDIKIMAFILNNFCLYKNQIAYYILYNKDLLALKMDINKGKEFVNIFQSIKNIKIWCSFVEDTTENCFRISIRSNDIKINDIAQKWNGGGHANASGAKIFDIQKELVPFLQDLYKEIK